jgi:hypothetical protein
MKKWFVMALVVCVAAAVQAGDGKGKGKKKKGKEITKEEYVAKQRKNAEKKGVEFDQSKSEANFDKLDKDGSGTLTADEKTGKKKKKGKKAAE